MKKYLEVDPRIKAKHCELGVDPVVIRVKGTFNEDMAERFATEMERATQTGQPVIPVVIDSYGGQVYSLLDMISQIQTSKLPVATILQGKAMSAGGMLFIFGSPGYRYMADWATLMIHDVSSGTWGKVEEIKSSAEETERLHKLIFKMAAKHLGQKDDYFLKILHEKGHAEWYLTAKDAKKHGICDHIGVPEMTAKVSVDFLFG